jgi:hypothetical protein
MSLAREHLAPYLRGLFLSNLPTFRSPAPLPNDAGVA